MGVIATLDPILVPLILVCCGFLLGTIFAAYEVVRTFSSPPHPHPPPAASTTTNAAVAAAATPGSSSSNASTPQEGQLPQQQQSQYSHSRVGGVSGSSSSKRTLLNNLEEAKQQQPNQNKYARQQSRSSSHSFISQQPQPQQTTTTTVKSNITLLGTPSTAAMVHQQQTQPPPSTAAAPTATTTATTATTATTTAAVSQGTASQATHGSSGDSTRRSFYKLILVALLCRLLLLPIQAFYFSPNSEYDLIHPQTGLCNASPGCIFSRTLPDLAFASAFSLLVLFYAQLAGTASGGGPRGLSLILTRRGTFSTGNGVVYVIYAVLFFFTGVVHVVPYQVFQITIWGLLCVLYLTLLCLLSYFGPMLVKLLKPSLQRRSALALRLIAMCVLCALVFFSRTVCFGLAVGRVDITYSHGIVPTLLPAGVYGSHFVRDALSYTLLELLPSVAILSMMHQRRGAGNGGAHSDNSPSAAAGSTPPLSSSGPSINKHQHYQHHLNPSPSRSVSAAPNTAAHQPSTSSLPRTNPPLGGPQTSSSSHHHQQQQQQQQYHQQLNYSPTSQGSTGMIRVTSGSAPKRPATTTPPPPPPQTATTQQQQQHYHAIATYHSAAHGGGVGPPPQQQHQHQQPPPPPTSQGNITSESTTLLGGKTNSNTASAAITVGVGAYGSNVGHND